MAGIPTPKIFETGAMKMEAGLDASLNQSTGWGDTSAAQILGAGDAFPWIAFGNGVNIGTAEDKSITTKAFKSAPRLIEKTIEQPISMYSRYKDADRFFYWFMGFENVVTPVVVLRSATDPFSAPPVIGDTYNDGVNDFDYLRTETLRDGTFLYIFHSISSVVPSGNVLTNLTGDTCTFDTSSVVLYEHLYELDASGRRYRFYNDVEKTALGLGANDKRNLMCTLAKRMANYDLRYANSVVKGFKFNVQASELATWESNYMAFLEERGEYGSSTWTLTPGLCDNSLVPAHFEMQFSLGSSLAITEGKITGLTNLGITDFTLTVDTPLQSIQDFISGLSIAEPVIEDKYDIQLEATLSRHTVETYQQIRDNQDKIVGHLVANQNDYMQEFMFKEITIQESGPDDSNVAQEPLKMTCNFNCGTTGSYDEWLFGNLGLQNSPFLFRVRNDNPQNEMLRF